MIRFTIALAALLLGMWAVPAALADVPPDPPAPVAPTEAAPAGYEAGKKVAATAKARARAAVFAKMTLPEPAADATCDTQLPYVAEAADVCIDLFAIETRTSRGLPYLKWAYLAVFAILLGFFALTRVRQRRLEIEMQELRARLTRLTPGASAPPTAPTQAEPAS